MYRQCSVSLILHRVRAQCRLAGKKYPDLAYGQQSTYQAEYGRAELVGNIKKPGYGYKHGVNKLLQRETWQGETGIQAEDIVRQERIRHNTLWIRYLKIWNR